MRLKRKEWIACQNLCHDEAKDAAGIFNALEMDILLTIWKHEGAKQPVLAAMAPKRRGLSRWRWSCHQLPLQAARGRGEEDHGLWSLGVEVCGYGVCDLSLVDEVMGKGLKLLLTVEKMVLGAMGTRLSFSRRQRSVIWLSIKT